MFARVKRLFRFMVTYFTSSTCGSCWWFNFRGEPVHSEYDVVGFSLLGFNVSSANAATVFKLAIGEPFMWIMQSCLTLFESTY